MNNMKRRISIFLCILMVFTTVFAVAPTEVQAANDTYSLYNPFGTWEVNIYYGMKDFNIGHYITASKTSNSGSPAYYYTDLGALSQLKGVSYKSSKPSVASISSKGVITTKKNGSTVITVKYKGLQIQINLKVISKSKLMNTIKPQLYGTSATTIEKNAKAFLKKVGTNPKLTTKNRYKLLDAYKNYSQHSGYISIYNMGSDPSSSTFTYYIFSGKAKEAQLAYNKLSKAFNNTVNPFSTTSSKYFQIKSLSGKANSKTINVTLKNKVTENDIFGAMIRFNWDTEYKKSSTYSFPVMVENVNTGYKYYGVATINNKSSKMKIELKNHKLVKGHTYKIISGSSHNYLGDWADYGKNTFKVTK